MRAVCCFYPLKATLGGNSHPSGESKILIHGKSIPLVKIVAVILAALL